MFAVIYRLLWMAAFAYVAWQTAEAIHNLWGLYTWDSTAQWITLAGGALVGLLFGPLIFSAFAKRVVRWIRQIPARSLFAGTVGLIISLVLSALVAMPLSALPGELGRLLPPIVASILVGLGITVMVMREQDILNVLQSYMPGMGGSRGYLSDQIILDTSAIIDGRLADISQTGFIHGTLVIPRFVLDELRHIADSPEPLRRNRGRRGLDMLSKLQKSAEVPVQITEADFDDIREVDAKLVKLAKTLRSPIITTDYNLNRVAELQGVRVLNINELTNAVKSVVLPGEEMEIRIIQEGKEAGQGVGFLDDGTMVVVEGGSPLYQRRPRCGDHPGAPDGGGTHDLCPPQGYAPGGGTAGAKGLVLR